MKFVSIDFGDFTYRLIISDKKNTTYRYTENNIYMILRNKQLLRQNSKIYNFKIAITLELLAFTSNFDNLLIYKTKKLIILRRVQKKSEKIVMVTKM